MSIHAIRLSKVLNLFLKSLRTEYSNLPILKCIRARDRAIDHASWQINVHDDDGHRHVKPGVIRHHQSQYIQILHCFMMMLQRLRRGIVSQQNLRTAGAVFGNDKASISLWACI